MAKIDIDKTVLHSSTRYPAPFDKLAQGREKRALGDVAGLTQFGVNLTRLKPGGSSALRHWHESEDEFVYVLEGEITLIEDGGETLLRPGEAAGFKAGTADGHHLVNRSRRDALYLEIGSRAARDRVRYPDVDLVFDKDESGFRYSHRSGEPYAKRDSP